MATFKTDSDKKALKAIKEDSLPDLFLPLDLSLKSLPVAYIHVALVKKAQNIIAYMATNRDEFKLLLTPSQLLFYVCANWNDDEAIPIVSMLDNNNPGLVMNSLDAFGRNALWYIFYNRERFNSTTEVAQFAKTPLAKTLIELGCNPDHKNSIDLSYNDVTG